MSMQLFQHDDETKGGDMARAKAAVNQAAVREHVRRLKAAGVEPDAREFAYSALISDASLSAADVIEISEQFVVPAKRPGSKKAALELISKRFVELARQKKQIAVAAKVRI
jgi:hypothetical protein